MRRLNDITNSIADDYLLYSGRGINNKSLITPQEYLMFRSQALDELRYGIHCINEETPPTSHEQKPHNEIVKSEKDIKTESSSNNKRTESPIINEVVPQKPTDAEDKKIIPISSASKKQENQEINIMLDKMKKAEG